jgi:hypothetical protein
MLQQQKDIGFSEGSDMSVEDLITELSGTTQSDLVEVREKTQRALDAAVTDEQRGRILSIFSMTLDQAERNLAARGEDEALEQLKVARAKCYRAFVVRECTVGHDSPGGGDVSVEMLMAATNREIAAGRMSEDHPLRKMAVEGAAAPHLSHAQLIAKHARQAPPPRPVPATPADGAKVAYALGNLVGRKLKGWLK